MEDQNTDMFVPIGKDGTSAKKDPTCPEEMSYYCYGFVIIFDWDPAAAEPFRCHALSKFSEGEIRTYWIRHHLEPKWRAKCLKKIKSLPGEQHSLFGKIETCKCNLMLLDTWNLIYFFY